MGRERRMPLFERVAQLVIFVGKSRVIKKEYMGYMYN